MYINLQVPCGFRIEMMYFVMVNVKQELASQGKHVGASLFLPLDSSHATLLLQQLSCNGSCFKGLHC